MQFSEGDFKEFQVADVESIPEPEAGQLQWINVEGLSNISLIESFGARFNIHPLTLEDIVHTDQRPKYEDYDAYDVAIIKMLSYLNGLTSEQLSIIIQEKRVITFQEKNGVDAFEPVRDRIRSGKGRVRKQGADYLAYALIDSVVDTYFNLLEDIGEHLEKIDQELIRDPQETTLHNLFHVKRELIMVRKALWPLREVISNIQRTESKYFTASTGIYLRDVYDHTIRIIETTESYRDISSGMMDIYHSRLSNKMNEIMKVLTIISTIFIPVTFIAGVYGMNFDHMPELRSEYGYPITWAIMLAIMLSLLIYFRKKKWL